MAAGIQSPLNVTPSRSFQSFPRNQDTTTTPPSFSQSTVRTPASSRASLSLSDCFNQHSSSSSTQTPSSGSSSPTPSTGGRSSKQHYQRPSTLHGLKHKLHTSGCSKTLHATSPSSVPNRRKSVGHIPLSPLARTPSPSPLPASPTRSPSPLAFPVGHQPGSSNTTQSYSPNVGGTPAPGNSSQTKKGFVRPKTAEPGSPLLRRALSPDRLHPRSAESKCSLISPLCSSGTPPALKAQVRGTTSAIWRSSSQQDNKESEGEINQQICENSSNTSENRLSLNLAGPGELLPRIAEEKDSPTNGTQETKTKCDKEDENKQAEDVKKSSKQSEVLLQKNDKHNKQMGNTSDTKKLDSKTVKPNESSKVHEEQEKGDDTKKSKQGECSKVGDETKRSSSLDDTKKGDSKSNNSKISEEPKKSIDENKTEEEPKKCSTGDDIKKGGSTRSNKQYEGSKIPEEAKKSSKQNESKKEKNAANKSSLK